MSLTYQPGSPQGTAADTVTDDAAQTLTRRYLDPYGSPVGASPSSWPDNLGYAGQSADPVTGLGLLGARQYDPATGRFLSQDPLSHPGDPLAMNGYSYADDDPATDSDPSGLECAPGASTNGSCNDVPVQDHGTGDPGSDSGGYSYTGYGPYAPGGYAGYGDTGSNPALASLGKPQRPAPAVPGSTCQRYGTDCYVAPASSSVPGRPSVLTQVFLAGVVVLTAVDVAQAGLDPVTDAADADAIADLRPGRRRGHHRRRSRRSGRRHRRGQERG